jgi:hypothetical protein
MISELTMKIEHLPSGFVSKNDIGHRITRLNILKKKLDKQFDKETVR